MNRYLPGLLILLLGVATAMADMPVKRTPKEALQTFNDLIGEWKATGTPEGTREEKQKGFWTESLKWRWQFKGDDAWLQVFAFDSCAHRERAAPAQYLCQVAGAGGIKVLGNHNRRRKIGWQGGHQGRKRVNPPGGGANHNQIAYRRHS